MMNTLWMEKPVKIFQSTVELDNFFNSTL